MNHQTRFDTFELSVSLQDKDGGDFRNGCRYEIRQSILINGSDIAPDYQIDLIQLAKSCQLPGAFPIVTCDCGEPDCAGIYDGIVVSHLPDAVEWEIPDPLSFRDMTDEQREEQQRERSYRCYTFDPTAYFSAVWKGLCTAKSMLFNDQGSAECTPVGFYPADLLDLDPHVFSERGAPAGCQIIAKRIEIDIAPDWVTIGGISYQLEELPVPDEIKSLSDWSAWEPRPGANGYFYGYAAAPSWEQRRRLKKLGRFLASVTRRDCEIAIVLRQDARGDVKQMLVYRGLVPTWSTSNPSSSAAP